MYVGNELNPKINFILNNMLIIIRREILVAIEFDFFW